MIQKCRILFLREIPALVAQIKRLDAVILSPGSTSRDLNLLFLFSGGTFPVEELAAVSKRLEEEVGGQFGESLTINAVPRHLPELDKYFLAQILRDGYVVYGAAPVISAGELGLEPMSIVTYSLKGKTQQEKTRLGYQLYGRKLRKGKSEKTIAGRIHEAGGTQLGPGTLLLPEGAKAGIMDILREQNIKHSERKVWTDAKKRA